MEEGTALAFTVLKQKDFIYDYNIRIRKHNTVFQAECTAIKQALIWGILNNLNNINIYTDSMSALQAINTTKPKHPLTLDILNIINENKDKRFHLNWTKPYIVSTGNERAD